MRSGGSLLHMANSAHARGSNNRCRHLPPQHAHPCQADVCIGVQQADCRVIWGGEQRRRRRNLAGGETVETGILLYTTHVMTRMQLIQ